MMRLLPALVALVALVVAPSTIGAADDEDDISCSADGVADGAAGIGACVVEAILREAAVAAAEARRLAEADDQSADVRVGSGGGGRRSTSQPLSHWRESLAVEHIDVQLSRATAAVVDSTLLSAVEVKLVLVGLCLGRRRTAE